MIFRSWKVEMWMSWWIWACTGSFAGQKDATRLGTERQWKKGLVFLKIYESLKLCLWEYGQWKLARNLMQSIEIRRDSDIYSTVSKISRVYEYRFSKLHICRYISESLYNFMEVTCIHSLLHSVSTNTQDVTPVPPQRLAAATAISRGGLGSYTCGL